MKSERPSIAVVVPTYNEEELLAECVASIATQEVEADLTVIVVNAGEPLSSDLGSRVHEVRVPSNYYWTQCIKRGFDLIRQRGGFDYVLMANADTTLMPGTVTRLLQLLQAETDVVACSPVYRAIGSERPTLLFSRDRLMPFVLHNFLERKWTYPEDAPDEVFETDLTGGQGVLFPASFLERFDADDVRFPHYKGDMDLWLSMKREGVRLLIVAKAGVVNRRAFGEARHGSRWKQLRRIRYLVNSPLARDSWRVAWKLRKKHLGPVKGFVSTFFFVGLVYPWRVIKLLRPR